MKPAGRTPDVIHPVDRMNIMIACMVNPKMLCRQVASYGPFLFMIVHGGRKKNLVSFNLFLLKEGKMHHLYLVVDPILRHYHFCRRFFK
jgi:hypothetical protein